MTIDVKSHVQVTSSRLYYGNESFLKAVIEKKVNISFVIDIVGVPLNL